MPALELAALFQAARALGLGFLYAIWARSAELAGRFDGDAGLVLLGKSLLIFIAVTVGLGMVFQIIAIIVAIVKGEESRPGDLDERDREIERRAMSKGFSAVGFGFLGLALALWYGWGAVASIHILLAGFVGADLLVNVAKFVSYWRQRP